MCSKGPSFGIALIIHCDVINYALLIETFWMKPTDEALSYICVSALARFRHFSTQGKMLFREFATPIPTLGPMDTVSEIAKMIGGMVTGQV